MEPGNFEGIRMTLNLATPLRESAQSHSDHAALILGDTTLTYSTLHALVRCFAGGLGTLGLARGEHVALLLPNVPQFTIAYFGGHYAGCPIVPLNVLLTAEEIAYHLADSRAAASDEPQAVNEKVRVKKITAIMALAGLQTEPGVDSMRTPATVSSL
jgi:acyl-CoA synthetase (AMP-forming)/AMP-acid ligase II